MLNKLFSLSSKSRVFKNTFCVSPVINFEGKSLFCKFPGKHWGRFKRKESKNSMFTSYSVTAW